jgi:hypothetical protein
MASQDLVEFTYWFAFISVIILQVHCGSVWGEYYPPFKVHFLRPIPGSTGMTAVWLISMAIFIACSVDLLNYILVTIFNED